MTHENISTGAAVASSLFAFSVKSRVYSGRVRRLEARQHIRRFVAFQVRRHNDRIELRRLHPA